MKQTFGGLLDSPEIFTTKNGLENYIVELKEGQVAHFISVEGNLAQDWHRKFKETRNELASRIHDFFGRRRLSEPFKLEDDVFGNVG